MMLIFKMTHQLAKMIDNCSADTSKFASRTETNNKEINTRDLHVTITLCSAKDFIIRLLYILYKHNKSTVSTKCWRVFAACSLRASRPSCDFGSSSCCRWSTASSCRHQASSQQGKLEQSADDCRYGTEGSRTLQRGRALLHRHGHY